MLRRFVAPLHIVSIGLAAIWHSSAGAAEPFTLHDALEDSRLYYTAPLRWDLKDWSYLAVAAAAIGAAHEYDATVRSHFAGSPNLAANGQDPHSLRDAAPAMVLVAGTWATAALLGDPEGYGESWSLLEAGTLSSVTGEALKYATGRERPNVTRGVDHWRDGGDAFPSVHASAAFAVGAVFAESGNDDYRWIRRIVGYGVAGGTAYIRLKDNVHWLSDTVAGAALGIATARFVLERRVARDEESTSGALHILPTRDGWMLSYSWSLH